MALVAVDTNVLLRLLVHDDVEQAEKAKEAFATHEIFVPWTVWLESEWVLRHSYGFPAEKILEAFEDILGLPNVRTTSRFDFLLALDGLRLGSDFADALHQAGSQAADRLLTFDRKFAARADDLEIGPPVELL